MSRRKPTPAEAAPVELIDRLSKVVCREAHVHHVTFALAWVLRQILIEFGDEEDRDYCVAVVRGDPEPPEPAWASHIAGEA